jgi:hypothetical protein
MDPQPNYISTHEEQKDLKHQFQTIGGVKGGNEDYGPIKDSSLQDDPDKRDSISQ